MRARLFALHLLVCLLASHDAVGGFDFELGNFCVHDFVPAASCVANDVYIESIEIVSLLESCTEGVFGEMEASLRVLVSPAGPNRYDLGIFLSTDANTALGGDSCLHGYLSGPLTATPIYGDQNLDSIPDLVDGVWWDGDGDDCGDIQSDTQVFITLAPQRFSCTDFDQDGRVDLHGAISWDPNGSMPCAGLSDAIPPTASRCWHNLDWALNIEEDATPVGPISRTRVQARFRGPNPFGSHTTIEYFLPAETVVSLSIHDLRGRRLRSLLEGEPQNDGWNQVRWDGMDDRGQPQAAGVYFFRLQAGDEVVSGRIARVR